MLHYIEIWYSKNTINIQRVFLLQTFSYIKAINFSVFKAHVFATSRTQITYI